jgi:CTP:molybdopterin cytidylyltransferase MocA
MTLTILIPAAGNATRMRGGDKLLEPVAGEPMLRRQARIARSVCAQVIVTLRDPDPARMGCLQGVDVTTLSVQGAAEGMAASIRAGAVRTVGALMILPADMPEITAVDLQTLIAAFDQSCILRATASDGTPGHPVIFPADLLAELAALQGDEGGRAVVQRHRDRVHLIALPDQHATLDLDTPEAWAQWRVQRG